MNTKKKHLFVIQNDLMGGAEQLLKYLSIECVNQGVDVDVIIVREPMKNNWDEIKKIANVKYLNSKSYLVGFLKFFLYIRKNKVNYDIVFSSNININSLLGVMKRLKVLNSDKLIIRETTSVFLRNKGLKKWVQVFKYKIGYKSADLIICQSEVMKDQFLNNLKESHSWNLTTLQNPIDLNTVKVKSLAKIDINTVTVREKYIVTAGRLISEKGFDILIDLFNEIKDEIVHNLIILGDGNLFESLKNQIDNYNLGERVKLVGFKDNPFPFFKHADICVVSSRYEGFPNVLLEMSLLNNRVVSTNCAGNIDKIPSIYIAEPNNKESLKIEILKCLNNSIDNDAINRKYEYLSSLTFSNYFSQLNQNLNEV